jgi:hypothetical protein
VERATKYIRLTILAIALIGFSGCGDAVSDLLNSEPSAVSDSTADADASADASKGFGAKAKTFEDLDDSTKKFFEVISVAKPSENVRFLVDGFSFISTDSITTKNLSVVSFEPITEGAESVEGVVQFPGLIAIVKLVEALRCGQFLLGALKIMFCPGSINIITTVALSVETDDGEVLATVSDSSIVTSEEYDKIATAANATIGAITTEEGEEVATEEDDEVPVEQTVTDTYETINGTGTFEAVVAAVLQRIGLLTGTPTLIQTLVLGTSYQMGALGFANHASAYTTDGTSANATPWKIGLNISLVDTDPAYQSIYYRLANTTGANTTRPDQFTNLESGNLNVLVPGGDIITSTMRTNESGTQAYVVGSVLNKTTFNDHMTVQGLQISSVLNQTLMGVNPLNLNPSTLLYGPNSNSSHFEIDIQPPQNLSSNPNGIAYFGGTDSLSQIAALTINFATGAIISSLFSKQLTGFSINTMRLVELYKGNQLSFQEDNGSTNFIFSGFDPNPNIGILNCNDTFAICEPKVTIPHTSLPQRSGKTDASFTLEDATEIKLKNNGNSRSNAYFIAATAMYFVGFDVLNDIIFGLVRNNAITGDMLRIELGANENVSRVLLSAGVSSTNKTYAYVLVQNTSTEVMSLRVYELSLTVPQ